MSGARDERLVAALLDAVAVMDRLRSPGGCPWDAEQTHASLAPYAVEEAHEVAEAAEAGDLPALREELGDLLLQVLFHARVAQEAPDGEAFDLADVASVLAAKLRRRHPHVFAVGPDGPSVTDADGVNRQWDAIKAAERADRSGGGERGDGGAGAGAPASVLDGAPATLPALMRAQKVLGRARKAGIAVGPVFGDDPEDPDDAASEIGAELLAVVARAAAAGVDAEAALRAQVRGVVAQVHDAEANAR
ncbi:MAG TPA: nucleoside triphosphate pyrophosphohydrolase [Micrococcales bacterium]|uniref:MazG family protein n=1 Tax=Miniimonas arenae TaxID=676201 RepID=UPI000ECC3C11|nr:MazG family protein [Miniimonas arenae]HCX85646.1 nucleoside triphosphate pyrophosphohydrolase [Micrococcales bacterium]